MDIYSYNKYLCEEYKNKRTSETLSRYVISEVLSPIEDYINALSIIRNCPDDILDFNLLTVGAFWSSEWECSVHNEFLYILNSRMQKLSLQERSIVCYLNAYDLIFKDIQYKSNSKYERYLCESIKYWDGFVFNFTHLAELYTGKHSKELYEKALSNVICVKSIEEIKSMTSKDFINIQNYINEHILGTHISYINYELLIEKHNMSKIGKSFKMCN